MSNSFTMSCGNVVTKSGEVFSRLGRRLSQHLSNAGYLRVELHSDGSAKKHSVHRLVALAFVPNPDGKECVNHIDGVKTNNAAANLEWVTRSENQKHAYALGLQKPFHVSGRKISDAHKAALCGSRWNGYSRQYWADGVAFSSPEEAAEFHNISRQTVYNRAASSNFPNWSIEIWREVK